METGRLFLLTFAPLLLAHACQVEESEYRVVARGQYAVVYESNGLDGDVCPGAAAEVDRQVKDLATALRVEVPDDFKVVARVEPDEATVKALCDNPSFSGCAQRTADGDSLLITAQYLLGHETVPAVQRLRESRAHRALREGEAEMFADLADSFGSLDYCMNGAVSEANIRQALDDPGFPGAYDLFHEVVVRVYQLHGAEAFDALWAASAADPTTEGLLRAFEDVLDTTLFDLMQEPLSTCRDQHPGCGGLERRTLPPEGLSFSASQTCGPGVTGLQRPEEAESSGRLYRSYVMEIPEDGMLSADFNGEGASVVHIGACDGFDSVHGYGFFTSADEEQGSVFEYPVEAGSYRVVVIGFSNGLPSEATLHLEPAGG